MKKFRVKKEKRTFIVSLLLVAAIAGAAITIALAIAQSNAVTNTFKAADHETGIVETVGGLNKDVTVKNNSESSPAFIRVRMVVSPEDAGIQLVYNSNAENEDKYKVPSDWAQAADGFYYYLKAVPAKGSTSQLLDEVEVPEGFTDTFDVTVYEESCVATVPAGQSATLDVIKNAFDKAAGE